MCVWCWFQFRLKLQLVVLFFSLLVSISLYIDCCNVNFIILFELFRSFNFIFSFFLSFFFRLFHLKIWFGWIKLNWIGSQWPLGRLVLNWKRHSHTTFNRVLECARAHTPLAMQSKLRCVWTQCLQKIEWAEENWCTTGYGRSTYRDRQNWILLLLLLLLSSKQCRRSSSNYKEIKKK